MDKTNIVLVLEEIGLLIMSSKMTIQAITETITPKIPIGVTNWLLPSRASYAEKLISKNEPTSIDHNKI